MENPTSLLLLNDFCLVKIFQSLELRDLVNLTNTCQRLRDVTELVSSIKYKDIVVGVHGVTCTLDSYMQSQKEFTATMAFIGKHISTIEMFEGNNFITETIGKYCKNLTQLHLLVMENFKEQLQLPQRKFPNLKELKLFANTTVDEVKIFFYCNADIESLEWCFDNDAYMALLPMLRKLKSLRLSFILQPVDFAPNRLIQHLIRLDGLTKLTFEINTNCNDLLVQLATHLNLMELCVYIHVDGDTFEIIKLFKNLEVLSLGCGNRNERTHFPDNIVLPPKLKDITLSNFDISCSAVISLVKQLTLLKELRFTGCTHIYYRHKPDEYEFHRSGCDDPKIISRIANELNVVLISNNRFVKIAYPTNIHDRNTKVEFFYNSNNLKISNQRFIQEMHDYDSRQKVYINVYSRRYVVSESEYLDDLKTQAMFTFW